MKQVEIKIAEVISAVLNAPLVTLYAFFILIYLLNPSRYLTLLIISAFFSSILPLITIYRMVKKGTIPDMYASIRQTRTKPFLAAIISYFLGIIVLLSYEAPISITALMACYFVNSIVMMLITRSWKISIHASGITGPGTFLLLQFGLKMLPFFVLLVPVFWARLRLRAHDLQQLAAGALLTIGLTFVQVELYLR